MIKLNLLEKKKPFLLPSVLGMDLNAVNLKMLAVAIVLYYMPGITTSFLFEQKTLDKQTELQALTAENVGLRLKIEKDANIKVQVDAFKDQVSKLELRSKQVDEIMKNRTNPKKVLEKIARSIPEDVWFDSMEINDKNEMVITGGANTSRSIGEFITNINDSPYFGGTIVPRLQENRKSLSEDIGSSFEYFELFGKIVNYDMRSK